MNVMKLEELARLIREAIQTQGLLQKDIAAHCGMTPAMLSNAMAGRSNMREERWRLACEYCGIDYDAFMGYNPSQKAPPLGELAAARLTERVSPAQRPAELTEAPPPAQRRTRRNTHE